MTVSRTNDVLCVVYVTFHFAFDMNGAFSFLSIIDVEFYIFSVCHSVMFIIFIDAQIISILSVYSFLVITFIMLVLSLPSFKS